MPVPVPVPVPVLVLAVPAAGRVRAVSQPPAEQPALSGIVEADETYFRRNDKGATPVGRRARMRGTRNGSALVTARNERKRGLYHVQTVNS